MYNIRRPLNILSLDHAIDHDFLTVAPHTPLVNVLALTAQLHSCQLPLRELDKKCQKGSISLEQIQLLCQEEQIVFESVEAPASGCVLVMEESQLIGVFTDRDIVRLAAAGIPLKGVKVADLANQPVITLQQSADNDIFSAIALFRQHRIRHLPIVDERGQPVGVVTHESIRKALQPVDLLTRLRQVKDLMTSQVIHAPVNTSVIQLARLMTQHQVSSVVITEVGEPVTFLPQTLIPVGIVTERDIVQFQTLELDLAQVSAQAVMSTPLFFLDREDSLRHAQEEMQRYRVRRLVVTNSRGELAGIISQTSLLQVLNPADMYGVIEMLQQAVEKRTAQLEQTNQQLRQEIAFRQHAESELLKAHAQLQEKVKERTIQLTRTNEQLRQDILERQRVEEALRQSEAQSRKQATQLKLALGKLNAYQAQLIQTEKMSSLGQLVAGIAHEINNPINFIQGNIAYTGQYVQDLMHLLQLYEQHCPQSMPVILTAAEEIDLNFLKKDLPKVLKSMRRGADRIRDLVLSLRNFSRLDESEMKSVSLHEGLDNTLLILQNQLKAMPARREIRVIKEYSNLPPVECYAGQLNQVFMNLLTNAIDALEELRRDDDQTASNNSVSTTLPSIIIGTGIKQVSDNDSFLTSPGEAVYALIKIKDNGCGMTEAVHRRLFDPFFTTKSVGQGTGLGLLISYQIVVEKHGGQIYCISSPGQGTEFVIEIPVIQQNRSARWAVA
ncbi:MAG: CBS domain-containing protein [Coleofasciculaceae cyanobacterium]